MASERQKYPPIEEVTQVSLQTNPFAHYSGIAAKTLRNWASKGGPITPDKKVGRLNFYLTSRLRKGAI